MKFASFIITALMTVSAMASHTTQAEMVGRVTFKKSYTVTCMALNCPPSLPYYQLTLEDVDVKGLGEVESVVFEDFKTNVGSHVKPKLVVYGGVSLKEGSYIVVKADVTWNEYGRKVYVSAVNPESIYQAPVRHPVMLY